VRRALARSRRHPGRRLRRRIEDWLLDHELLQPKTVAAVFLVVIGFVGVILIGTGDDGGPPASSRGGSSPPAEDEGAMTAHVNLQAGYRFRYPITWEVAEDGTLTKLQSPKEDVVISFGLSQQGGLEASSEALVASIEDAHHNSRIIGAQQKEIGGSPSVIVAGLGTNDSGLRVRFLAITVEGEPNNYAISVFVPASSDADRLLPPIQRIVGSFRPSSPEDTVHV
jgi:hypothetical protein